MKKAIFSAVLILILLSACTVQETVDPNIFVSRLTENGDFVADTDTMHYGGNVCALFLDYKSELRLAAEMTMTENGTVSAIAVSADGNNDGLFVEAVKTIIKVYAPNENADEIIGSLFADGYSYSETQWYDYAAYSDNETLFFCIKNKKLSPESEEKLTLREE